MAIRAKLVLIFFFLFVLPMFVIWALWQNTAIESVKSALRLGLSDQARVVSSRISASLTQHQSQLLDLTRKSPLRSYAQSLAQNGQALPDIALRSELGAYLLGQREKYSALIGVNRQGNPVFKIEPRPGPLGIIRPFFQDGNLSGEDILRMPEQLIAIKKDNVYISEIQPEGAGAHVKIIAPLRDDSNNVAGALIVKVRVDQLLSDAAGPNGSAQSNQDQSVTNQSARAQTVIISPQGTVLYASDKKKEWKSYNQVFPDFAQPFAALLNKKDKDLDWQSWLIRHRLREESPKLSILAMENSRAAVGNLEFSSYVLLLLTFALVLVTTLFFYSLISTITDSIRRVTKGAKAIATGNLGYQINVKSRDETRVLADAFNRMASRLREMIRKEGEQKQFESFARLSAVLTHDLKNQILSLSLLVNNMERKFDREGFREDAMRTLSDSVNNLQNLVAKLSDPRTPTKRIRERSNLTHLVDRVIQRTAGQATNRFKISANLTPELYAVVDGKAIERVVENLVINALEAMPEGGSLNIATLPENDNVVISISDTGKGMTEEFVRERLFHPFATTKKKGIGLGLYSCREIIEQHGGRIDVASQVEVGTEFRVVLPMKVEEPKAIETKVVTV